jgi:hypothetical protein
MNKYREGINNYNGDIYRKCKEVSLEMQQVFPELRIAKGLVNIIEDDKQYQHQWLVSPEGDIIDPTAKQWAGVYNYIEIKENDPYPIGKCMNCGEWVFSDSDSAPFCSERCAKEYIAYCNGGTL